MMHAPNQGASNHPPSGCSPNRNHGGLGPLRDLGLDRHSVPLTYTVSRRKTCVRIRCRGLILEVDLHAFGRSVLFVGPEVPQPVSRSPIRRSGLMAPLSEPGPDIEFSGPVSGATTVDVM